MPTINDLPIELLHLVLDQLHGAEDADELLAASLVARRWRAPAQAQLWNDISITDREQIEKILRTSISRCHKTRSLVVSGNAGRSASAIELLATLVDLKKLTVSDNSGFIFAMSPGSLLDESWVSRGALRGLRSLSLNTNTMHVRPGSTYNPAPAAFALSFLRLGDGVRSRSVIESIFTSSTSTLTTLELEHPSPDNFIAVADFISLLGSSLKSLSLRTSSNVPFGGFKNFFASTLAYLTALEKLFISAQKTNIIDIALEQLPPRVAFREVGFDSPRKPGRASSVPATLLAKIEGKSWGGMTRLELGNSKGEVLQMKKGSKLL